MFILHHIESLLVSFIVLLVIVIKVALHCCNNVNQCECKLLLKKFPSPAHLKLTIQHNYCASSPYVAINQTLCGVLL